MNCQGFLNVLEAAKAACISRVVWASASAVFDPQDRHPTGSVANDASRHPGWVYAACKSYREYLVNYYQSFGVDSIGFRFNLVYGRAKLRDVETEARGLLLAHAQNRASVRRSCWRRSNLKNVWQNWIRRKE